MGAEPRGYVRGAMACLVGAGMLFGLGISVALADSDYELDIQGTLEVRGSSSSGGPSAEVDDQNMQYWVYFRYEEQGAPEGVSSLDRGALVTDGKFEIPGLRGYKVYRVTVEKVVISDAAPGGVLQQVIPLDIPSDFFLPTQVHPSNASASQVVEVELPVARPTQAGSSSHSLGFLYTGTEILLSALQVGSPTT